LGGFSSHVWLPECNHKCHGIIIRKKKTTHITVCLGAPQLCLLVYKVGLFILVCFLIRFRFILGFLLFCWSCFFAFLLLRFFVFLLLCSALLLFCFFCFSAFLSFLLLWLSTSPFFAALLLPAPLLLCFLSLLSLYILSLCCSFSFALFSPFVSLMKP